MRKHSALTTLLTASLLSFYWSFRLLIVMNQHQAELYSSWERIEAATLNHHAAKKNATEPTFNQTTNTSEVELCPECTGIAQRAPWTNLSFVAVRNPQEHPHMGARNETGHDFVYDVSSLKRKPALLDLSNVNCSIQDYELTGIKRVQVAQEETNVTVLCAVYSAERYHDKLHAIRETWGPHCDGFFVASDKTDLSVNAINILHEGEEKYNNMWQKVRSIWSYIYDNYYEDFDWFHIGGDDMFLLVDNLKRYLDSPEIRLAVSGGESSGPLGHEKPIFLGNRLARFGRMNRMFNTGGPGYTINKAALKTLVVNGFPKYFVQDKTAEEDVVVAKIFANFGVLPYPTRDEDGGERYMHYTPGTHLTQAFEDYKNWYKSWAKPLGFTTGHKHVSNQSIAFHSVDSDLMRRLYMLAYDLC